MSRARLTPLPNHRLHPDRQGPNRNDIGALAPGRQLSLSAAPQCFAAAPALSSTHSSCLPVEAEPLGRARRGPARDIRARAHCQRTRSDEVAPLSHAHVAALEPTRTRTPAQFLAPRPAVGSTTD